MTAAEIDRARGYSYAAFARMGDAPVLKGDTPEDFQQDFLLVLLENPGISLSYAIGKLKMSRLLYADQAVYSLGNMMMFSDLIPEGSEEDQDYIDSLLSDPRTDPEAMSQTTLVYRLASLITKPGKSRERFLDFAFGSSLGSNGNRCVRELLFRHRFEVLEFYHRNGVLSDVRFRELWKVAESMTEPMKGTRRLKQSSSAVMCRKAYWKQKQGRKPKK